MQAQASALQRPRCDDRAGFAGAHRRRLSRAITNWAKLRMPTSTTITHETVAE